MITAEEIKDALQGLSKDQILNIRDYIETNLGCRFATDVQAAHDQLQKLGFIDITVKGSSGAKMTYVRAKYKRDGFRAFRYSQDFQKGGPKIRAYVYNNDEKSYYSGQMVKVAGPKEAFDFINTRLDKMMCAMENMMTIMKCQNAEWEKKDGDKTCKLLGKFGNLDVEITIHDYKKDYRIAFIADSVQNASGKITKVTYQCNEDMMPSTHDLKLIAVHENKLLDDERELSDPNNDIYVGLFSSVILDTKNKVLRFIGYENGAHRILTDCPTIPVSDEFVKRVLNRFTKEKKHA